MTKEITKKITDSLYGFEIDISFLDCIFQTPPPVDTIDIDYEDITNKRKELPVSNGYKKQYRKDKKGGVMFRFLSFIHLI